jgi:hypothetical protein
MRDINEEYSTADDAQFLPQDSSSKL